MATYECTRCCEVLDENEFHLRPPSKPGGRPVAYHCKRCRSRRARGLEVFKRELKKYGGKLCSTCNRPRKLKSVNQCEECLQKQGQQFCSRCEEVGFIEEDFMGVKGMCTKCWEEMIPELDEMLLGTTESLRRPDADRILDYQLKKYGLSLIEYKAMFESQTGRCAICKSAPTLKRLSVDHDHKTGAVRGLLCTNCNLGLGNFKDDQEILKAASDYLSGYFKPLD